jgi:heptosyltransferase-2
MKDIFILLIVKSLGFFLSRMPYPFLEKLTECLAIIFLAVPTSRRRLLLSNLTHAFPEWNYSKTLSVAKESSARMFEMGFFSLCYPFMSSEQRRKTVFYDKQTSTKLKNLRVSGQPVLMLIPHTCLFESLATSPLFRPFGERSLGAIYRPNKNPVLDKWITKARQKSGIKTFARKEGVIGARAHLKAGNLLALLYDQNAGHKGKGCQFLGRICSISPLPDLFAKNSNIKCVHAIARRLSFFRTKLSLEILDNFEQDLSAVLHKRLEHIIRSHKNVLPEWLWVHGKWKINNVPIEFFSLQNKFLDLNFQNRTFASKLIIRVPNWLGDIVMCLPLVRAIRSQRPDLHITIVCKHEYADWLDSLGFSDSLVKINPASFSYLKKFYNLRNQYPDAYLVFTNSLRGDIESYLTGASLKFGLAVRARRVLLNCRYFPEHKNSPESHQSKVWHEMLIFFGLKGDLYWNPLSGKPTFSKIIHAPSKSVVRIGIAPGSSNTPAKRLPVVTWVRVCKLILTEIKNRGLSCTIELFGTSKDKVICDEIEKSLKSEFVLNYAGKTNILGLFNTFSHLNFLICNDSGAMHLANSVGTHVFALFSTTNPNRTGPIFNGPKNIIKVSYEDSDKCISEAVLSEMKQFI